MRKFVGQFAILGILLVASNVAADSIYDIYRTIDRSIEAWHPEEARDDFQEMLDRYPDQPETHLAGARLLFHLGNYQQAVHHLDELKRIAGSLDRYTATDELIRTTAARTANMVRHKSAHFEIFTTPGLDEALAPFALETLEAQLDALQTDLGYKIPEAALPIRIEVYPRTMDFVAVSTLTDKEVSTSGTIALCKFNRMLIVSPRRLARGYKWRDTLSHELVHFYLSRMTRNRLPLWMHEGVAKFQEQRWKSPEIGKLHPIQESILAESRRTGTYVDFNEMMPSLAKLDSGWKTALAFAEVTLLIRHIIEDGGMPNLRTAILAFAEKQEKGFQVLNAADLDDLWTRFVTRLESETLNPVPEYKFIPRSVAEDPDVAEPDPITAKSGKKHTRLGDLLRREGHWAAAITQYTKAAKSIGHTPAPLELRIAQSRMLGGKYSEAEANLKHLLLRDPDRATTHWMLGKIALFKSDPETALMHYENAFAIAPFQREVLSGLVDSAEKLNDKNKLTAYRRTMEIFNEHSN